MLTAFTTLIAVLAGVAYVVVLTGNGGLFNLSNCAVGMATVVISAAILWMRKNRA